MGGLADQEELQSVVRDANREIVETGALLVRPEPDWMRETRVQPTGFWSTPREISGVVPAWYVVGPFAAPEGLDSESGPESGYDPAAEYDGAFASVRWVSRGSHGGVVGMTELLGGQFPSVTAYAACTVSSPVEQRVQMRVGTDDDGMVWLNGEEVCVYDDDNT